MCFGDLSDLNYAFFKVRTLASGVGVSPAR